MRGGVRLGIDVGKARIGVSRSDFHGMLATPIETINRSGDLAAAVTRIGEIAADLDVFEVIVGHPLNMQGESTASTADAVACAQVITDTLGIPVRMVDERLSTVSAQSALHRAGRNTKSSRSVIDQVAAVIILQQALDTERSSGNPPGTSVEQQGQAT